jgi:predicted HTH domain antitoxin
MIQIQTNEARIILVIEAIRSSSKISIRRAATFYEIPRSSFSYRLAGRIPCNKTEVNCYKLTEIEKEVIIRYILDLDTRGFAPRLASIKDIANYILESQGGKYVRKL